MQSPRVAVRSRTVAQLWRLRSAAAPYRYGETIVTIFIGRGAASPSMAGEISSVRFANYATHEKARRGGESGQYTLYFAHFSSC
jgi:hypothetical protein